jgi:hypothetical protein
VYQPEYDCPADRDLLRSKVAAGGHLRGDPPAIARTTPILLGLFSLVTLLANTLARNGNLPMRQAVWYTKTMPTFSDALAAVRAHWWRAIGLATSRRKTDMIKVPRSVFRRLHEAACYAA